MKLRILIILLFVFSGCFNIESEVSVNENKINYPKTKKVDQVDDYYGTLVSDPYRWLEDLDSEETAAWVTTQNEITFDYLHSLPSRDELKTRLTELYDYTRISTPSKKGGRFFYYKNTGLQNQSLLYYKDSLSGTENLLLDPNSLSEDGTVALSMTRITKDGQLLAYGVSESGSDWKEVYVRDIDTGKDFVDHIQWMKFSSITWLPDNSGFIYSRYPIPKEGDEFENVNSNQKVYLHILGTNQSEDFLIYSDPEHPQWGFGADITDDGKYLLLYVWEGTRNEGLIYFKETNSDEPFSPLISEWIGSFSIIGNDSSLFYVTTDYKAPRNRIIKIDTQNPEEKNWTEIIPQSEYNLRRVQLVNNEFVCIYNRDIVDYMEIYTLDGKFRKSIQLPGLGTAGSLSGEREDTEMFFGFTSHLYPSSVFQYDFQTGKTDPYIKPDIDFNPEEYVSTQVFYSSKDGTKIPMFIIHKKGVVKDGSNPTYLYGYGGFNVGLFPHFSVSNLPWLERGGIYAIANLRGGSEYGEEWHKAGMLLNKQNVFDDFIAASEFLIENEFTSPEHLAIGGGSNGGLLVSAVMIQRPDLFAAVNCRVPVTDMLRYNKFTIGWAWESDYGSPEDSEYFSYLYKYSPLHNVEKNHHYPAILVSTSDHDDRVVPSHSFKFAATLQEKSNSKHPQLIRIETKAGHGAGLPMSKRIDQKADVWAFLLYHTNR